MNYFNRAFGFIKDYPLKSLLIVFLDILFYALLFAIFVLCINLLINQVQRVPIQIMGNLLQSLEGMEQLQQMLLKMLIGIIRVIILFFVLVLLNIAIMKEIIWMLTLNKTINYKVLLKSVLITFTMGAIFFIPLLLSLYPFYIIANQNVANNMLYTGIPEIKNVNIINFIPFAIVVFFIYYLLSLCYYFLAKSGSFRQAFKNSFKFGFTRFLQLSIPFIGLMITVIALFYLFRGFAMFSMLRGFVLLIVIILISFFNRVYIVKLLATQ